MFAYLLQGLTYGISAAVSPGPFQAYLLSKTVSQGWKRTLPAALAPLISDGPIIALVVVLLAQTPDWFLNAVRIAGGLFLLRLSWEAFQSFKVPPLAILSSQDPSPAARSVFKAALVNALGPGPYIFWGFIAGPVLVAGWRSSPSLGVSFMLGFYATLIGGSIAFIILFATARRLGDRVASLLKGISVLGLLVYGGLQLWQGLTAILTRS